MNPKQEQLGMNPSTAQQRLLKDILFRLVRDGGYKCHHCGVEMAREDFSIEHKKPWLHEPNAKELFFDQDNIAFSHFMCNVLAARRPHKKYFTAEEVRQADNDSNRRSRERNPVAYNSESRREKYLRRGT